MLREVMFASAVWSCVLPRVSEAVEAFVLMHAAAVGRSRARRKAILYTHTFLSLFGLSAGKTRQELSANGTLNLKILALTHTH